MKGGGSLRDHLEAAARNGEDVGDELDLGPMPDLLGQVMPAFREVARSRRYAEGMPLPVGPVELDSWFRAAGRRPCPYLGALLLALDDAWLLAMQRPDG